MLHAIGVTTNATISPALESQATSQEKRQGYFTSPYYGKMFQKTHSKAIKEVLPLLLQYINYLLLKPIWGLGFCFSVMNS
jgi:hypothetical protein